MCSTSKVHTLPLVFYLVFVQSGIKISKKYILEIILKILCKLGFPSNKIVQQWYENPFTIAHPE